MNNILLATSGAVLLTLMSTNGAVAAILTGQGNISGVVKAPIQDGTEIISSSLGVNVGDEITGNYSLEYERATLNLNKNYFEVPLTTFNLSVGTQTLSLAFPSFLDINPVAIFRRDGNSFHFDTIVADLRYSAPNISNIYTQLTGGETLFGNKGEGLLFATAPVTTGWTSGTQSGGFTVEGGITQTCQGSGCWFAVPEPITGLVLAAGLGGAALKRAKDKSKKS